LEIDAGQNVYAYVGGDPLNRIDPFGLNPIGAAIGAIGGGALTAIGSIGVDIATGGLNILATPEEILAGAALGGIAGDTLTGSSLESSAIGAGASISSGQSRAGIRCDDCETEWREARDLCREELQKPNPSRGITGGYSDIESCARGHVSERCGGNRISW
jgi:hypothetical protein